MMKNQILAIAVCCITVVANSQKYENGDIVRLTKTLKVDGCPTGINDDVEIVKNAKWIGNYKYQIINTEDEKVKLVALDFKKPWYKREKKWENINAELYNGKIYTVEKDDFIGSYEFVDRTSNLSIGLVTLPYKARYSKGASFHSFDTEFTLNSTLNYKFWRSFSFLLGTGIGNVGLNTSNASGLTDEEAIDAATLSFLYGIMYEYNSIQVGAYFGKDFINNQDQYNWNGHNKPWVALGIGYGIFKIGNAEEERN